MKAQKFIDEKGVKAAQAIIDNMPMSSERYCPVTGNYFASPFRVYDSSLKMWSSIDRPMDLDAYFDTTCLEELAIILAQRFEGRVKQVPLMTLYSEELNAYLVADGYFSISQNFARHYLPHELDSMDLRGLSIVPTNLIVLERDE